MNDRDIRPADVAGLAATPPDWLVAEQQRQQARINRESNAELCRGLTDVLIASVHEVWFQELKCASTDAEAEAIDARWAPEAGRAKREARRLVDELPPEQVRVRIDGEDRAAGEAARYRATQLARRAFGADGGR